MAVASQREGEEVEQAAEGDNTVADIYKYGGAFALIGLEFFYREGENAPEIRVRLNGLHGNGETYRATDVRTERRLENSVHPKELKTGRGTRGGRDPVILLMKQLNMPTEAYLDPHAERPSSGIGIFRTPEDQFRGPVEERRISGNHQQEEPGRGLLRDFMAGAAGRGRSGTPLQRAQMTPPPQRYNQPYRPQYGQAYQPVFRPAPFAAFNQHMHGGAGGMGQGFQQDLEEEGMQIPGRGLRRDRFDGLGGVPSGSPFRRPQQEERFGRDQIEAITSRLAALEESRQIERERGAMSTELRRMQSSISPFEHPGIYAHVDEMVTMHELPSSWGKPLSVAGASGNVLIADNVKLAFLKDAIWEFTKRKCAEGGEVLTEKQIRDIEAQTMEFYGKQRVEAKKILEKARITPGKGNK
jgi:hypothetical protein